MLNNLMSYDIETYPDIFTLVAKHEPSGTFVKFELSERKNEAEGLAAFLISCRDNKVVMVGYNNLNFDYPVLHHFMINYPNVGYRELYTKADHIINGERPKYGHSVAPWDVIIPQIDLFRVHHFNNAARATSLKYLEFVMRAPNIEDLPFNPGQPVGVGGYDILLDYNVTDVVNTSSFLKLSMKMLDFRVGLIPELGERVINYSDVKIGAETFRKHLEAAGVDTKKCGQTINPSIELGPLIFDYIEFNTPGFKNMLNHVKSQTITETKGVFDELNTEYCGVGISFGLGGIHASIEAEIVRECNDYCVIDYDVASYYPNIGIKNKLFPDHLGPEFYVVWAQLFEMRKLYKKGTVENAGLKLALNGAFGGTNDKHSFMFDSKVTMAITLNGQFMLCMLAEWLCESIPQCRLIQMNTDGLTIKVRREDSGRCDEIVNVWETMTQLTMERADYKAMYIRDVNSYMAHKVDGSIKRVGAYKKAEDLGYHQNHSKRIVPIIAEEVLLNNTCPVELLLSHSDPLDFMMCAKVPRRGKLWHGGDQVQNTTRYVISNNGSMLVKELPSKKDSAIPTYTRLNEQLPVQVWNDITDLSGLDINYKYYHSEILKLTECFNNAVC